MKTPIQSLVKRRLPSFCSFAIPILRPYLVHLQRPRALHASLSVGPNHGHSGSRPDIAHLLYPASSDRLLGRDHNHTDQFHRLCDFGFIRAQIVVLGPSGGTAWPWLTTFGLLVGAPLSEELLFRGFLLSALAKSRIGFWGAALIVNSAWTALHHTYSWSYLFVLFTFGLLLTFIIWRTGSLWACIFAHATNNLLPALSLVLFFIIQHTT